MNSGWLDGIRAVSFDVGGTLIEPWPSVGHVYAAAATRGGFGSFDPLGLNLRFYTAWKRHSAWFDFTKDSWRKLVGEALADLGTAATSPELFEAIWIAFMQADAWRIFDDVQPCLAGLRERGLRCCVVSNWDERLVPTLRNLGLDREFECIVASAVLGVAKPAPEIFAAAQRELGLPAHQILHVGDTRREDREGAAAAGFRGVWLDRSGREAEADIRRLTDLLG
jgi:putative hydrolase of the HAD superfamily